jgi:hypothetical protein
MYQYVKKQVLPGVGIKKNRETVSKRCGMGKTQKYFGLYCKLVYICIVVRTDCAAEPGLKNTLNS